MNTGFPAAEKGDEMKIACALILVVCQGDQIERNNWYAKSADYRSIATLQMIQQGSADFEPDSANLLLDCKLERFDFVGMVDQFDTVRSTDSSLTAWPLSRALAASCLGCSDADSLSGDLADDPCRDGALEGTNHMQAQDGLAASASGSSLQLVEPLSGSAGGSVSLLC